MNNYLKKLKKEKRLVLIIQISILLLFLIIWELLSRFNIINNFIFSSPSNIFNGLINMIKDGSIIIHVFTTIYEILIAFILGFIISFILSILLFLFPIFHKIIDPYLTILNSLPKVSLGPLLIILFGARVSSIIIMALLINVIVSTISIYTGFIKVDKYYIDLFNSFRASKIKTLLYLVIPNSRINIISSLKINISMTLIGVIMVEFLVSKAGIGYLILYGTQVFNLNLVYIGILLILIVSYLLYKPIHLLEKRIKN